MSDAADPQLKPTDKYEEEAVQRARQLLNTTPEQIGPYRILERIGGGGMGEVYRAEQRVPIRREVALKFIKLGMDTKSVIARFEAERQALALMDHPHIAKVFDAGTDDSGRPYFVMEYVKGKPITDYADKNQLTIADRLELVEQVCQAIQHAHHKGVIHRDLKPSNVLVSTQDGKPFAKVIDFGIAKAIGQQLTDKTLFTLHEQFIGTPQYMSPEQAEGNLDVDTRTDVYSLGVLLYELLAGSPPFSMTEQKLAAWEHFRKQIMEVDPPKPSLRLSASGPTLPTLASSRRTEPKRLGMLVRGELDWIVMKALEKDRKRRYETPTSLANDLRAHLAGEPVQAAPPSTAYRLSKFVRRNKGPVFAAAAVVMTLLLGIGGTTWQMFRAQAAEQSAVRVSKEFQSYTDSLRKVTEQIYAVLWDAKEDEHESRQLPAHGTEWQAWGTYRLGVSGTNDGRDDETKELKVTSGFVNEHSQKHSDDGERLLTIEETADPKQARKDLMGFLEEQPLGLAEYVRGSQKQLIDARKTAEQRLAELNAARAQSDELLYRSGIQLVYDMVSSGQILEARKTLDALPEQLRGWEWRWLKAETTGPLGDFTLPEDDIFVAHSNNGRYAVVRNRDEPEGPFRLFDALTHAITEPLVFPPYDKCLVVKVADTGRVAIFAVPKFTPEAGVRSSIYLWDPLERRVIWEVDSGHLLNKRLFTALRSDDFLRMSRDGTKIVVWGFDFLAKVATQTAETRWIPESRKLAAFQYNVFSSIDDATLSGIDLSNALDGKSMRYNTLFLLDSQRRNVLPQSTREITPIAYSFPDAIVSHLDNGKWKCLNFSTNPITEIILDSKSPIQASSNSFDLPPLILNDGGVHAFSPLTGTRIKPISLAKDEYLIGPYQKGTMAVIKADNGRCLCRNLANWRTVELGYVSAYYESHLDEASRSLFFYDQLNNREVRRFPLPSADELDLLAETNFTSVRDKVVGGLESDAYYISRDIQSLKPSGLRFKDADYSPRRAHDKGRLRVDRAVKDGKHWLHLSDVKTNSPRSLMEIPEGYGTNNNDVRTLATRDVAILAIRHKTSERFSLWKCDLTKDAVDGPLLTEAKELTPLGVAGDTFWATADEEVLAYRLNPWSAISSKDPMKATAAAMTHDSTKMAFMHRRMISVMTLPDCTVLSRWEVPVEGGSLAWTDDDERVVVMSWAPEQTLVCDPVRGRILLSMRSADWRRQGTLANQFIGSRIPFRDRWPLIQATAREEFDPIQRLAVAEELVKLGEKISSQPELATAIALHDGFSITQKAIAFRLAKEATAVFSALNSKEWVDRDDMQAAVNAVASSGKQPPHLVKMLEVIRKFWSPPSAKDLNQRSWEVVAKPKLTPAAYAKALKEAIAADKAEPDTAHIVNTLGIAQYRAGQFAAAVKTLERSEQLAMEKGKSFVSNHLFIGMAKSRLGDFKAAIQVLDSVSEDDRKFTDAEDAAFRMEALDLLGYMKLSQGNASGAISAWKRFAEKNDPELYLRIRLAAICAWYGLDVDLAIIRHDAIMLGEKAIDAAHSERCAKICCFSPNPDRGQLERARACIRESIRKAPNHQYISYFHLALGMAEYRLGEYASALREFEIVVPKAVGSHTLPITAGFFRAMTLAQLNRLDEAKSWQSQAAQKMKPAPEPTNNPLADNNIATVADDIITWLASRECETLIKSKSEQD